MDTTVVAVLATAVGAAVVGPGDPGLAGGSRSSEAVNLPPAASAHGRKIGSTGDHRDLFSV
jgi:hypothetical protein